MRWIVFALLLTLGTPWLPAEEPTAAELAEYEQRLAAEREAARRYLENTLLEIGALPQIQEPFGYGYFLVNYRVTKSGFEEDWRDAGLAIQANRSKQLSEAELAKLRQAILALPAKSIRPPGNRLVHVGFWEGPNWVARTYDCESLPEAMRQIYDIIGERFETRKDGLGPYGVKK